MTRRPLLSGALVGALVATAVAAVVVTVRSEDGGGLPTTAVPLTEGGPSTSGPAAPVTGGELALRTDGLGAVAFGTPDDDTVAVLTGLLGPPDEDSIEGCEADPALEVRWVRWADLSVALAGGVFDAWVDGSHYPPGRTPLGLATPEGLALGDGGDRLAELYADVELGPLDTGGTVASRPFSVPSAGPNFFGGFLEGRGDGTLVALRAGDPCSSA